MERLIKTLRERARELQEENDRLLSGKPTYIFGYGSLICEESRARSGHSGECFPVTVSGFRRSWSARVDLAQMNAVTNPDITGVTAVSVQQASKDTVCSGVIVQIQGSEIAKFDLRETGYTRMRVSLDQIKLLSLGNCSLNELENFEEAIVYVYVATSLFPPTPAFPIIQSYVDVMLKGCSAISDDFLEDFVRTTDGWSEGTWLNDR
jgi:cation transport regulator ChaC